MKQPTHQQPTQHTHIKHALRLPTSQAMGGHAMSQLIQRINRKRIAALQARAMAALRADSSLSVRLKRYNQAMNKARALQAKETNHASL